MKIHEYQAKDILAKSGIPVPAGRYVTTADGVKDAVASLGGRVVVKAQVHAGGRGKAGGVRLAASPADAEKAAMSLLGSRLVTHQTGPDGVPVRGVLVEEALDVDRELYAGIVLDGAAQSPVVMASEAGGMEIEQVAESTPQKIIRVYVDPGMGLMPYQGRRIAYGLGFGGEQVRLVAEMMRDLYGVYESLDCSLAEINPLVVTTGGQVLAADAKLAFDDDALFRHTDLSELQDPDQDDPGEVRARRQGLSYVKLDGDVGCLVNGAGLAMATMDVIVAADAAAANFLDVGGGADEEKVAEAMQILLSDPSVKRVLVNIFGGILRCDIVARGVLVAAESMPDAIRPMVVRMLGTNAQEARKLLAESRLDVTLVDDLGEAAEAITAAA